MAANLILLLGISKNFQSISVHNGTLRNCTVRLTSKGGGVKEKIEAKLSGPVSPLAMAQRGTAC